MSLPDTREENNTTKPTLLITANNSTFYITRNGMMTVKNESAEWKKWFSNLNLKWAEVIKSSKLGLFHLDSMPFPTIMK